MKNQTTNIYRAILETLKDGTVFEHDLVTKMINEFHIMKRDVYSVIREMESVNHIVRHENTYGDPLLSMEAKALGALGL